MDWDDLKYILAVARHGTLSAGAASMKVNATTVSRRIKQLEEATGTALFDKLKHGAVLTDVGEEMVAVAEVVERQMLDLDARIHGRDTRIEGPIRVTTVGPLLDLWMADFKIFQDRYPEITLHLDSDTSSLSLTQRQADVAIRIATSVPEHLIGNRCAEVMHAAYASPALVETIGADTPYGAWPFVSYDLDVSDGIDKWISHNAPGARVVTRVGRIDTMVQAVRAGIGLSLLQCMAADVHDDLVRVGPFLRGGLHLWVLTHPMLRGSTRFSVFRSYVRQLIDRDRPLIEGQRHE